jgi:predicted ArsR family transcriptional regulator
VLLSGLKRMGAVSVEELATEAFLSPAATRQHLMALSLQGLVQYDQVRQGPGRPRHVFSLTPESESLFPQAYDEALEIVLAALGEEDAETQARVLGRARDFIYDRYLSQMRGTDPAARLEEVRVAFEKGGYHPAVTWIDAGHAQLSFLHCPLARLVERSRGACEAEQECIARALPGATVERSEFRPSGGTRCSYGITFANGCN